MSTETLVRCNSNLNFRLTGKPKAKIMFVAQEGTLVNRLTEPNAYSYALGRIDTYRKGDEMQTVADSMDPKQSGVLVEVKLGLDAVYVADKPVDEYGRAPGHVEGWFYVPYTTPVEATG